ncbi:hypothetical protein [Akkermansia muciniphila]|uniref:hypothetical protein n=1 Tax=Akkermansia muciniphila TaxID=239935 RepID=UPI0011AF3B46|nr:hypothetical protein [Akkermansia muciniphila]
MAEYGNSTTGPLEFHAITPVNSKNMGRMSFPVPVARGYHEIFSRRETGTKNPAGFTLPDGKNKGSKGWEFTRLLLCSGGRRV